MNEADNLTPFQRICLQVTGGCGCACHTGIGFKSACDHCYDPARATATDRTPAVVELRTAGDSHPPKKRR